MSGLSVLEIAANELALRIENLERHGAGRRGQVVIEDRAVGRIGAAGSSGGSGVSVLVSRCTR